MCKANRNCEDCPFRNLSIPVRGLGDLKIELEVIKQKEPELKPPDGLQTLAHYSQLLNNR